MTTMQYPASEFLFQLTKMLTDDNNDYIEWKGKSILVHDPSGLEKQILPIYFRHSNYSSFQRQMNYFGFRKIAGKSKMAACSYINENTTEDISSLLYIKRRKTGLSSTAAKILAQTNKLNMAQTAQHQQQQAKMKQMMMMMQNPIIGMNPQVMQNPMIWTVGPQLMQNPIIGAMNSTSLMQQQAAMIGALHRGMDVQGTMKMNPQVMQNPMISSMSPQVMQNPTIGLINPMALIQQQAAMIAALHGGMDVSVTMNLNGQTDTAMGANSMKLNMMPQHTIAAASANNAKLNELRSKEDVSFSALSKVGETLMRERSSSPVSNSSALNWEGIGDLCE